GDIRARLEAGADKVMINTHAIEDPGFISLAAREFGAQCIVIGIDARRKPASGYEVFTEGGAKATGRTPAAWAKEAERLGAGEIFLGSIDRDGTGEGYDLDLIRSVTSVVDIPVIAIGGVKTYEDFPKAIHEADASAAAAANIFHFKELSYPLAKRACINAGLPMRTVGLGSRWFSRTPDYDTRAAKARIAERLEKATAADRPQPAAKTERSRASNPVTWCTKCVYPSLSATPMEYDADGVCMGCRTAEAERALSDAEWKKRKKALYELLDRCRSRDGSRHDCIIPVSGGKDSYFQVHTIKHELGFNPLLVTYYGNNFTEVGQRNLLRMKEALDVDHVIYQPSVALLKKLNRLGFIAMGDMNWHNHIGIATVPMRVAAQQKIPLVIWGEHGYADISGQFSIDDYFEWTYRSRLEHMGRGFEWNFYVGVDGITAADMACYQYPSDQEIFELGLRGIYLSNYVHWDANEHVKTVVEKYGFEVADRPFERTYRTMSNLDDMHENGIHDYMKFIKFGYGRCTDHASKDIRAGVLSRGQAVDLVRKHDHVKPSDLYRWLDYVGMTEDEFDHIADTFRDPRVWRRKNGAWVKDNLWDA
ncbi:MAG: N-acetyl sugar amidotransferase, partial [Rhodospirillales bacterium]